MNGREPDLYCPTCKSCGIPDCCGLRCSFLSEHREAYAEMEREIERLRSSPPEVEALVEASTKVRDWLIRLAEASEHRAIKNARFSSLVEANEADAKNYRATAAHLTAALTHHEDTK